MKKLTVLITGASSGFGKLTAEKMISDGHIVYGAARRVDKMKDLETKGGHAIRMDVTDADSVAEGVQRIIEEQGQIDVLVNNAGYAEYGFIETTPVEAIKKQFDVNVFGLTSVTQAVLPHMRSRGSGRIINISSVVGKVSMPLGGWYAGTKHAVEAISDSLRQEVKSFGIDVSIVEPGVFDTGFEKAANASLSAIPDVKAYKIIAEGFINSFRKMYSSAPSPDPVVKAINHAATASRPKTRYRVGTDSKMLYMVKPLLSDRSLDSIMKQQMGVK